MFKTKVSGIPCYVKPVWVVDQYPKFLIYDRSGYPADWLETKMDDDDYFRLIKEAETVEQHGR
jgi:hypothetical protein